MKILLCFDLGLCILFYIKKLYYLLNLLQQNHYDTTKYMLSLKQYYTKKKDNYLYYFAILFLCIGWFINQLVCYYLFSTIALVLLLISMMIKETFVIHLKLTKRIVRLIVTISCIVLLELILFLCCDISYMIGVNGLILPFVVIVASKINQPVERCIQHKYKQLAIQKLDSMQTLVKIAITGSFGKTTTKHILYQILANQYVVTKTPKSYNTMMGLSLTINQELKETTEVFITEMGAFRKKEIEEMSLAIKPNLAIITEVGPQHLSTFHTIENVLKAKLEITKGLTGICIVNVDNDLLRQAVEQMQVPLITYGFVYGEIKAKNIFYKNNLTRFDIYHEDVFVMTIETKLLAKHNIYNILAAYATILALRNYQIDISDETFQQVARRLEASPHRLSYRYLAPFHIYDDSYSANLIGFKNALEVLKMQNGIKCIITPGIVDGGKDEEAINLEIAEELTKDVDEIVIIKNKASVSIIKFLEEKNICHQVFSNFMDAYTALTTKYQTANSDIHILIENDLPDSFLER